jgi:hypothetical protein
MVFGSKNLVPTRIKSRKSDGAPILFFFDFLKNDNFSNPILPVPLRIDKITNGQPTLFIFPTNNPTIDVKGKTYSFNLKKIYKLLLKNLLDYSKRKYTKITYKKLEEHIILKWWNGSRSQLAKIPSYADDMEFILQSFLEALKEFLLTQDEKASYLKYCDSLINHAETRFNSNEIRIFHKATLITKKMYKKKKEKFLPDIFEFDVDHYDTGKTARKALIPLFFYDDLLECFLYNKMQLEKEEELEYFAFQYFLDNDIIIDQENDDFTENMNLNPKDILSSLQISDFLRIV